jgi:hypothetical protein
VIPRQWKVIQTVREKFSCRDCETITQPPAPFHVTPRGFAGPQLVSFHGMWAGPRQATPYGSRPATGAPRRRNRARPARMWPGDVPSRSRSTATMVLTVSPSPCDLHAPRSSAAALRQARHPRSATGVCRSLGRASEVRGRMTDCARATVRALIRKIGKDTGPAGHQPRSTAIFMHTGAGVEAGRGMSVSALSGPARTRTLRPCSWGRPSSQ